MEDLFWSVMGLDTVFGKGIVEFLFESAVLLIIGVVVVVLFGIAEPEVIKQEPAHKKRTENKE